ncbi:MAG: hypothetical protein AAGK02_01830 [Pseudomonadota bacterium]
MANAGDKQTMTAGRKLPLALVAASLAFGLPSAGLAVVSFADPIPGSQYSALDIFTPASVDPGLAARVATRAKEEGLRFTPAGSANSGGERTVTVAVRVDNDIAQAIAVRAPAEAKPGTGLSLSNLQPTKYNLGAARGYQSFARSIELPTNVRSISMPDLADYKPAEASAANEPSRLQPRIELEEELTAGRSRSTLDALSAQTVDIGGSYSVTRNLDVTAGVRVSQERDRLAPLTDSAQDSQAVYVGTQFRF